jgi:hypothetical protein
MTDLVWNNDIELSEELSALYDAYKVAYREAKALRRAFENAVIADARAAKSIEPTETLKFSYNFGKLGIAVAPLAGEKPKAGDEKITLGSLKR